jgi:hypothetical protein
MATTYINSPAGSGTDPQIATFSMWFKITKPEATEVYLFSGGDGASNNSWLRFQGGTGQLYFRNRTSSSNDCIIQTNAQYKDVNGWYHVVLKLNSTLSTAADRATMYVNGEEITSLSSSTDMTQNNLFHMFGATVTHIGKRVNDGTTGNLGGFLASHVHFCDGYAYDASYFGQTDSITGEWSINTSPSVTYGTRGFFILKDGNSVTDQSGNSNNFTVGAGTLTNTEDNPSNVFCTYNPLIPSDLDYANGNTDVQQTSNTDWEATKGTLGFTEGKYYWEVKISSNSGDPWDQFHGIAGENAITSGATYDATPSVLFSAGGVIDVDGTTQQSGLGQLSDGDIIGIAVDADNSNIDFYRNGTQVGTTQALSSNSGFWLPFSGFAGNRTCQGNFGNGYFGTTAVASAGTNASGNGIFEYDVPTGYTALSTKGLNL